MLRASTEAHHERLDLRGVVDPDVDPLVPNGRALVRFATALVAGDDSDLAEVRGALAAEVGAAGAARAAAVAGNFQMMNRLVDASGVPIGRGVEEIAAALGVTWHHAG